MSYPAASGTVWKAYLTLLLRSTSPSMDASETGGGAACAVGMERRRRARRAVADIPAVRPFIALTPCCVLPQLFQITQLAYAADMDIAILWIFMIPVTVPSAATVNEQFAPAPVSSVHSATFPSASSPIVPSQVPS